MMNMWMLTWPLRQALRFALNGYNYTQVVKMGALWIEMAKQHIEK